MSEKTPPESDQANDEDFDEEAFYDAYNGPLTHYAMEFDYLDKLAADLANVDLKDLTKRILLYGKEAQKHYKATMQKGAQAIIFAWACGTTLNIAKAKLPHGQFGPWRAKLLKKSIFDVRTSQRYMDLAKKFTCVNDLTAWQPSLRQAYIACGILPEPPDTEKPAQIDKEAVARARLLKSVVNVQTLLRRFSTNNVSLDDESKKELVSAKAEIDELFKSLIG
jgi:hypothetical protein